MTSAASTSVFITLASHALVVDLHAADPGDRLTRDLPVGIDLLLRLHLVSDPPRPEELTNAIGSVAWVGIFLSMGFFFGSMPFVKENFSLVALGIIVISFIPPIVAAVKAKMASRKAVKAEPEAGK